MPDWFGRKKKDAPLHGERIEDYAMIGDCETAALISRQGSIDWLCWPSFSSGACFAALLGTAENGFWRVRPAGKILSVERHYRPGTMVLDTTFTTDDGVVCLTDFMPPRGTNSDVVRIVEGISGKVKMRMDFVLRFDYGLTIPWVTCGDDEMRAVAGPNMVMLRTNGLRGRAAALHGEGMTTVSEFTVRKGDAVDFTLTYAASIEDVPKRISVTVALKDTTEFWQKWAKVSTYKGAYPEAVERSLMTLKALTYLPTGGIVAAPTTGLPELLGGERNWDYRYCWLRDTAFTLLVLLLAGYTEEALQWRKWLLRAIAGAPDQLQAVYGISGERKLQEMPLEWLRGYEDSKPVRIGNGAAEQFQIDVFGEVAAALGRTPPGNDEYKTPSVELEAAIIDHLCRIWDQPDDGIWETRGPRKHYVFSKVMAWVALDRAVKQHERYDGAGDVKRWRKNAGLLHEQICSKGFNKKKNAFTQSYGSKMLDASCLRLVMVGFLPPDDPRIIGTVEAIERELTENGFVRRYDPKQSPDGLAGSEAAFLACSFWLVISLWLIGRKRDAKNYFEQLIAIQNDVGLLSEEYDPKAKRMLGNFPQALSHIALVHAAFTLAGQWQPAPYSPVK